MSILYVLSEVKVGEKEEVEMKTMILSFAFGKIGNCHRSLKMLQHGSLVRPENSVIIKINAADKNKRIFFNIKNKTQIDLIF